MNWTKAFVFATCAAVLPLGAATETNLKVIDLLVAYDLSARQWLTDNDRGSPEAFARENVDRMNLCLANSGLAEDFQFRLVGTMVVDVDTSELRLDEILIGNLKNAKDAEGEWKKVWQKRDALGADLFSFVSGGRIKFSQRGLGWTLATSTDEYAVPESYGREKFTRDWLAVVADYYCYNVLAVEALAEEGDYTMAHETAHNLGCGHAPSEEVSADQRFYDFSLGMTFGPYVSVMGYPDPAHFVAPVFSSPEVSYEGWLTGDADHDNVRTLRNNYQWVAQYRASLTPSPEPPSPEPESPEPEAPSAGSDPEDPPPDDPESPPAGSDPEDPPADDPEPAPDDPEPAPENPEPEIGVLGFTPTGAFQPTVAVKGKAPYVGALYAASTNVMGVVQLKIAKMNVRKGTSKVSGTVVLQDGRKFTVRATEVPVGEQVQTKDGIPVGALGTLSLTLGANGFVGSLTTADGLWAAKTTDVTSGLAANPAVFEMDAVKVLDGWPLLTNCLPGGTEVATIGGKWNTGKPATVKYAKVNRVPTLVGFDDPLRPNRSGLKLTYAAKTSSFKGSFTFYADVGTAVKPKLKKYKAQVAGVVVDGVGYGTATVKSPFQSWPVVIR